jgi:hypothetical protein
MTANVANRLNLRIPVIQKPEKGADSLTLADM